MGDATFHRALRNARPISYHGIENVSEHSLVETDGSCISYGLAKHIRFKKTTFVFKKVKKC